MAHFLQKSLIIAMGLPLTQPAFSDFPINESSQESSRTYFSKAPETIFEKTPDLGTEETTMSTKSKVFVGAVGIGCLAAVLTVVGTIIASK